VTHHGLQSDGPTLSSTLSSVRAWLQLLARYAWTRPPVYQVAGILAVAYTIVVAVDNETALWRWLIGLGVGMVGWGVLLRRHGSEPATCSGSGASANGTAPTRGSNYYSGTYRCQWLAESSS
jgi:hypothetical protein